MKVVKYKAINKGALLGSFSIEIEEWRLIIHELTLFQKNGHRWVTMPARKYEEGEETKYFRYCYFTDKEVTDRFSQSCLKAIDEYCKHHTEEELKNEDESVPF